jgi:hypothetical protein
MGPQAKAGAALSAMKLTMKAITPAMIMGAAAFAAGLLD